MATRTHSRVGLEIEAGKDPIRGCLRLADGTAVRFWGWLALIEELRRVAAEQPERAPPGGDPPPQRHAGQAARHPHRIALKPTSPEES